MALASVDGLAQLQEIVGDSRCVLLHFRAAWCEASKDLDGVLAQLATPNARFVQIEADEQHDICERYTVSTVPYFVFIKNGEVVDRLEGADPAALATKLDKLVEDAANGAVHANGAAANGTGVHANGATKEHAVSDELKSKLERLLKSKPMMLFMKGSADEPRCGFSRNVVTILKQENVEFGTFDILEDEEVRQGLKIYSNWPTYPQLYFQGELLGGCDVVSEMHKNGELAEIIAAAKADSEKDNAVAAAAEEQRNAKAAPAQAETLNGRIEKLVKSHPVMLFMKGSPEEPKCGFSRKVADVLKQQGVAYGSFDILGDEDVRQGIKSFSNWPTFPQLYVDGELVGGCDIVTEMHSSGELEEVFADRAKI